MQVQVLLVIAAFAAVRAGDYTEIGDCKATHEPLYRYDAKEEYFGNEINQTFEISISFRVYCKSVGTFKEMKAKLYDLKVTKTVLGGNILERRESDNDGSNKAMRQYDEKMQGAFHFVQTEDGSIPATLYSREDNPEVVNIKKAIASAFQANFKGTKVKEEADPQSLHKAEYTYAASLQDMEEGILKMHRKVTSNDVEGYASHIPAEEVEMDKEEDIVYKRGVLTHASGTVTCKLMTKENKTPQDDIEEDILEAEGKRKRNTNPEDPDEINSYDENMKTNHYESKGSYKVTLVGQRQLLRRYRSTENHLDLSEAVESTLLGFINHTRKAMEHMMEIRQELGDITKALDSLHKDPNNTKIAHKMEGLVKLEAKYGPLRGNTPAIDDVLDYLKPLFGSSVRKDVKMRFLLYFVISSEGSVPSQMALLESLEKSVNEEEKETIIIYIALVANPQPQFVAELEKLISSDVHSSDPLLLAYGGIISRASPDLQERMILFLMQRLPEAETNNTSLIHHILSLGNTASPHITSSLIDYLGHPDEDVQLTSIFAMRFLMNDPSIQKSLLSLLGQSHTNEGHITVIAKSLLYGVERAKINYQEKPYSNELAEALVMFALGTENEELHTALITYLRTVNRDDSLELLKLFVHMKATDIAEDYSNTTRFRRGSRWDERNSDYDLVAPLSERQDDVRKYQNRLAYIWGKRFGGGDVNAQVAAGGIAGVSNSGSYKLFGHAVAKATCYDRSLTILEFLVLRKKCPQSTESRVYAVIVGITLKNINLRQDSQVCKSIEEPLYEGKEYTIFDFTYSIFIVVGTLNFNLKATAQFTAGMYVEYCDNHGSVTAGVGLTPTLTLKVSATGDLEIALVAKGGITLTGTFNYQVLPEVSTEICYKQSQIRVKNCIAVYHQWTDNELEIYVWYAWRGWCGWWACTGSDAYKERHRIDSLSYTWDLPGTSKMTLWKTCDRDYTC